MTKLCQQNKCPYTPTPLLCAYNSFDTNTRNLQTHWKGVRNIARDLPYGGVDVGDRAVASPLHVNPINRQLQEEQRHIQPSLDQVGLFAIALVPAQF